MRVCVLFGDNGSSTTCKDLAAALAQGIRMQGHDVDLVDAAKDAGKIISYFDCSGVGAISETFFGGKVPQRIEAFLKQCGTIGGKRSFAFVGKRGLRQGKTLQALMRVMESQGMFLTFSEILSNPAFAKEVGKRLVIS